MKCVFFSDESVPGLLRYLLILLKYQLAADILLKYQIAADILLKYQLVMNITLI